MKTPTWPVLTALHRQIEDGAASLKPALYDAIADRLEAALTAETSDDLRTAAENLQQALYAIAKRASPQVRDALRGAEAADPELLSAFWAGQTAFAQLVSARALDRRADDRFVSRLSDTRYERYVRALLHGPQSGEQLRLQTGERKETVSRKLAALAALGVVERRRQGSHVVNVLAPAARDYMRRQRVAPWAAIPSPRAEAALRRKSGEIAGYLQGSVVIGETAVVRQKVPA